MNNDHEKENAAIASLDYVTHDCILGVGTGSTVNYLIENLDRVKHKIKSVVSSSVDSTRRLQSAGFIVEELSTVGKPDLYIDGADEVDSSHNLIKGGGGAHTREKIVASASNEFVCIVDDSKLVTRLGAFPLPVKVIPESRSLVARKIVSMGGTPIYRAGFVTDQGNHILDIQDLDISNPEAVEVLLNNIPGVVDNGIFAFNKPKTVLVSK